MNLEIDADVKAVAEFMQRHIAASRLVPVANAVRQLAPILWGRYQQDSLDALILTHQQPSPTSSVISLPTAIESVRQGCVDDGSAAEAYGRARTCS